MKHLVKCHVVKFHYLIDSNILMNLIVNPKLQLFFNGFYSINSQSAKGTLTDPKLRYLRVLTNSLYVFKYEEIFYSF